jgi:hypothetical protein
METEITALEAEQLAVIGVALCETSRTLDGWSRLLTGLALLLLWFAGFAGIILLTSLVVITGLIQA